MRKYIILFFSVLPFLFSCNLNSTPAGIIEQDQMAALLTQVHLADGTLMALPQTPDSLYKYGTGRYIMLFKQFHTDSSQFRKSYKYYTTKPEELQAIYDQVLKNLQKKSDSVTALIAKENTRNFGKKPFLPGSTGKGLPGGVTSPENTGRGGAVMPNKGIARPGLPTGVYAGKVIPHPITKAMVDSARKRRIRREHAIPKK